MKNIFLLETDKPSMLQLQMNGNLHIENGQSIALRSYQNIYITSDEEIKISDYILCNNEVYKWHDNIEESDRKIILTTDQDLIKDGIQAIDDEFLQWIVKNPSCESVEIENVYDKFLNGDKRSVSDFRKKYKINIPKEELKHCDICKMYPRLEGTNKCESCYSVIRHFLEQDPEFKGKLLPDLRKKQETLEEITEQIQKDCHKFVESIISKVTYQDATNTFLFMKLAELTLKLKKYE